MTLSAGTKLGPYEIQSPLGAGGMGEVYRVTDARLERDVALKVLRPEVAADPERRARFEREAKTVAALSHPNIVALYEVGNADGVEYTVSPVRQAVELATRLAAPSPLYGDEDSFPIGFRGIPGFYQLLATV
jgi:serine/threonine protein kinase